MLFLESNNKDYNKIINVNSDSLIEEIKQRVCYFVENLGLRPPWSRIRIHFITPEEMNKRDSKAEGLCYSHGDGYYDIYIRCGYSYLYTKSILAHEVGHTWINHNHISISKMENEGFCQLLAYQILYSDFALASNNDMVALSEWKDEVYGDGFRLMKVKLDSLGWSQLLMLLQFSF